MISQRGGGCRTGWKGHLGWNEVGRKILVEKKQRCDLEIYYFIILIGTVYRILL
jgi:hypothetical protein